MVMITSGAWAEVAYLTGVNADGTLTGDSYWTERDGDTARKWGASTAGTGATITYAFEGASNWTAAQRNTFLMALELVEAIANVDFVAAPSEGAANILLRRAASGSGIADAGGPNSEGSGSTLGSFTGQQVIRIDPTSAGFELNGDFSVNGGFGISTILHELQHAIGIGHGGNYNANIDTSTQQESIYDTKLYTTMSYVYDDDSTAAFFSDYVVTGTAWDTNDGSTQKRGPHTWMALDILAVQRLYGEAEDSIFSGGQTFGFNATITGRLAPYYDFTVNTTPVVTIYSQGGGNTLDLSGFSQASNVDLDDGAFSSAGGITNNIGIAYGTIVSRVSTGDGNDTLQGAEQDNHFRAGLGTNTIRGLAGDDTLIGGAGLDSFEGGDGIDTIDYRSSVAGISVNLATGAVSGGLAQGDTLVGVERILATSAGDTVTGSDARDSLFGFDGDDSLVGGGEIDRLVGGSGNDTLDGGAGADLLFGGGSVRDLVRNGGFENATVDLVMGANGFSNAFERSDGWADFRGKTNELLSAASGVGPTEGSYAFDLESSGNRSIFQNLEVEDGVVYTLRFNFRKFNAAASAELKVQWGEDELDVLAPSDAWQSYTIDIVGGQGGPGFKNNLYFTEQGALDFHGTLLDSVRVFRKDEVDPFFDGADSITTGAGSDEVFAGGGDDVVVVDVVGGGSIKQLTGGFGIDLLRLNWSDAGNRIFYEPYTGQGHGFRAYRDFDATVMFKEFERYDLTGGFGGDLLLGDVLADTLAGGLGDDTFRGGGGADSIDGGDGIDVAFLNLSGRITAADLAAAKTAAGKTFADGTFVRLVETIRVQAGDGDDELDMRGAATTHETRVESGFSGGKGADTFKVDLYASAPAMFDGGDQVDLLVMDWSAATGPITYNAMTQTYSTPVPNQQGQTYSLQATNVERFDLKGGAGDDRLYGGALDDVINPGLGRNLVDMGTGFDTLVTNWAGFVYSLETWTFNTYIPFYSSQSQVPLLASLQGSLATGYSGSYQFWADTSNGSTTRVDFTGVERFDLDVGYNQSMRIVTGDGDDVIRGVQGTGQFSSRYGGGHFVTGRGVDSFLLPTQSTSRWEADKSYATEDLTFDLAGTSSYIIGGVTGTVTGVVALGTSATRTFKTGSGHDTIDFGTKQGDSFVSTGDGIDTVKRKFGYAYAEMGAGFDTLMMDYSGTFDRLTGSVTGSLANGAGFDGFIGGSSTFFGTTTEYGVRFKNVERFDVTGSQGNDSIATGEANDTLRGGSGSDTLDGGGGNDSLYGGAFADDVLKGGAGADRLDGESGNDTASYEGSATGVTVDLLVTGAQAGGGDAGGDQLVSIERLIGSGEADTLSGNDSNNTLSGGGGNDTLRGRLGPDSLLGGAGADTLFGGFGLDILSGGTETDLFKGTADELHEDTIADLALGESIILDAAAGASIVSATFDTDRVVVSWKASPTAGAQSFFVTLTGLTEAFFEIDGLTIIRVPPPNQPPVANPDVGFVSRGSTALFPAGLFLLNDTDPEGSPLAVTGVNSPTAGSSVALSGGQVAFTATSATAPATAGFSYTASDGADSAAAAVTINLVTTGAGVDVRTVATTAGQASWIEGLGGNDRLTGGAGFDALLGGEGADRLIGGDGRDQLGGGAGNDSLDGGTGLDTLAGGSGNDLYTVDATGDLVDEDVVAGTDDGGVDVVDASATFTLGAFVENLKLTAAGLVDGTGNDGANRIEGFTGNNVLSGLGGADSLLGGGGDDTLLGGAGVDTLTGGAGTDRLDGGEEGDTYFVDLLDTVLDTGAGGRDKIIMATGYTLTDASGIEDLQQQNPATAPAAGSTTTLVGNGLANVIVGNGYDNRVRGLGGADSLQGGAGADTLEGGAGVDSLRGDAGADVFFFQTADSPASLTTFDTILDFTSADDTVDLVLGAASLAVGAYGEVALNSNTVSALQTRAETEMAAGKKVVFVAGSAHGWLFWNADADAAAEGAVRLFQKTSLAAFEHADLM